MAQKTYGFEEVYIEIKVTNARQVGLFGYRQPPQPVAPQHPPPQSLLVLVPTYGSLPLNSKLET